MLAVGADGIVWTFFSLAYHFSLDCPKGPLNPKQPTNQITPKKNSKNLDLSGKMDLHF